MSPRPDLHLEQSNRTGKRYGEHDRPHRAGMCQGLEPGADRGSSLRRGRRVYRRAR